MRRLLARSRAELVARAYVNGLLAVDAWPPRATGRRCYDLELVSESAGERGRDSQTNVVGL